MNPLHVGFTPLCITVDGLIGNEMRLFLRRLADNLSSKWNIPYSLAVNWTQTKLSFSLLRATNLCTRGTRSKWRGINMEDGYGINPLLL